MTKLFNKLIRMILVVIIIVLGYKLYSANRQPEHYYDLGVRNYETAAKYKEAYNDITSLTETIIINHPNDSYKNTYNEQLNEHKERFSDLWD